MECETAHSSSDLANKGPLVNATIFPAIYDGSDQRIIQNVTAGLATTRTLYIGSFYEETLTGAPNPPYIVYYILGSKMVGMRRANQPGVNTNGQFRVVGDQLGSTTLIIDTAAVPNVTQREYYKPFGEVAFTSGSNRTDKGFTGQRLDSGSGLMYYGARYYDPVLSYFISPDSIVPSSAGGSEENSKLTVDFHESGFLSSATGENLQIVEKGFWFQLSGDDRQKAKSPWGPSDAQSLNRYSYVQDNPLRYTDPSGHTLYLSAKEAVAYATALRKLAEGIRNGKVLDAGFIGSVIGPLVAYPVVAEAIGAVITGLSTAGIMGAGLGVYVALKYAAALDALADMVTDANTDMNGNPIDPYNPNPSGKGVAIEFIYDPSEFFLGRLAVLNRTTGAVAYADADAFTAFLTSFDEFLPGHGNEHDKSVTAGYYFSGPLNSGWNCVSLSGICHPENLGGIQWAGEVPVNRR